MEAIPIDNTFPPVIYRCPLCGEIRGEKVADGLTGMTISAVGSSRTHVSSGQILRCESCGLQFQQARPSATHLADLYRTADSRVYESEEYGRQKTANGYMRLIQRFAPSPGSILDIGCAHGLFLQCAKESNWQVCGIEPNEAQAQRARAILGSEDLIHNSTLEAAPVSKETFDVVTMWDILEHIPDPVPFLRRAASLLRPGGLIFVKVPNPDSLQARVFGGKWPLLLPEHLNYFNFRTLQMCGSKADLQWVTSRKPTVAFSVGYVLYRLKRHHVAGSSMADWFAGVTGMSRVVVPLRIGEICGIWKR